MSDLIGYISSFFVSFGLGFGFLVGGLVFVFLIAYGFMFFTKRSRRVIREDETRNYPPMEANRMVPVRKNSRSSGPQRPTGPFGGAVR